MADSAKKKTASTDGQKKIKRKTVASESEGKLPKKLQKKESGTKSAKKTKNETKTTDVKAKKQTKTPLAKKGRVEKNDDTPKANDRKARKQIKTVPALPSASGQEEDFIRGKLPLVPNEAPSSVEKAREETLFGVKSEKKKPTVKRKTEEKEEKEEKVEERTPKEKVAKPVPIQFGRLSIGFKMVGVVTKIEDMDITVSLPSGLVGYLSVREVSDQIAAVVDEFLEQDSDDTSGLPKLSQLFVEGQLIRVVVVHLTKKGFGHRQRVELSMRPSLVNRGLTRDLLSPNMALGGSIKSVEENGYVVDLGLGDEAGHTGFLPFSSKHERLAVGHPVECAITKLGTVISLTSDKKIISSGLLSIPAGKLEPLDTSGVLPGSLVDARVEGAVELGLRLSCLNSLTATADVYHLATPPQSDEELLAQYPVGTFVKARVLFVDVQRKQLGLSFRPFLLGWKRFEFPEDVCLGAIFRGAIVLRSESRGVTVNLPNGIQGFAHKNHIEDKLYTIGKSIACRVLALQHVEGIASLTLKAEVINQPIFLPTDLKPGQFVEGIVLQVTHKGALVGITKQIKGLIFTNQLTDVVGQGTPKGFAVGSPVKARVLFVDKKNEKVFLTSKKTLLNEDLPMVDSYDPKFVGTLTCGAVIAVKDGGALLQFFGETVGYLPLQAMIRSNVLKEGEHPNKAYTNGQLVQVRVTLVRPETRRMLVSLATSLVKMSAGEIVSGVVIGSEEVEVPEDKTEDIPAFTRQFLLVSLTGHKGCVGRLDATQLTDHPSLASRLFACYPVGTTMEHMLVLSVDDDGTPVLTAKPMLLEAFVDNLLPSSLSAVRIGMTVTGYIRKIKGSAVNIAFMDGLGGAVTRDLMAEGFIDPFEVFRIGQTVIANVELVESEKRFGKILLRLARVSMTQEQSASFVASYIRDKQRAEKKDDSGIDWRQCAPGTLTTCKVVGAEDFGTLGELSLKGGGTVPCVAVRPFHTGGNELPEVGSTTNCLVLDHERQKKIVDVSFRPELLLERPVIKPRKLVVKMSAPVAAVVQLVKDQYYVLTLTSYGNAIALALAYTPNSRNISSHRNQIKIGDEAKVFVSRVPSSAGEPVPVLIESSHRPKPAQKATDEPTPEKTVRVAPPRLYDKSLTRYQLDVGVVLLVKLVSIEDNYIKVDMSDRPMGLRARIHVSEILDLPEDESQPENPLTAIEDKLGGLVKARIVHVAQIQSSRSRIPLHNFELSLRPSVLRDAALPRPLNLMTPPDRFLYAYIRSLEPETNSASVDVSRVVGGKLEGIPFEKDPALIERLVPGAPVRCVVTGASHGKLNLRLATEAEGFQGPEHLVGQVVPCRIVQLVPTRGLKVSLPSNIRTLFGLVHITDISDEWPADPLKGLEVNQQVNAYVLSVEKSEEPDFTGASHPAVLHLSMRASRVLGTPVKDFPEVVSISALAAGQVVKGYVKTINPKGCWISLSRDLSARVMLKNLSDGFVEEPEKDYPPGKLVAGRILDIDLLESKIDVTLRPSALAGTAAADMIFGDLKKGSIVKGKITSIRDIGVFIQLLNSRLSGLCHISQIADTRVKDISRHYAKGDLVRAKVLKLDPVQRRISFGLKASLFSPDELEEKNKEEEKDAKENEDMSDNSPDEDEGDEEEEGEAAEEEENEEGGDKDDEDDEAPLPIVNLDDDVPPLEIFSFAKENEKGKEKKTEESEEESEENEAEEEEGEEEKKTGNAKTSRRAKASAKKRAETKLTEKEHNLLDPNRAPESAEEFKRLLVSSPNSSFLWVKFMAFYVEMTELEKARAIAEQALKTINFREHKEKYNVWMALMNLENLYGTADSLKKVFDRAKERNDAKKITMGLCHMLEGNEKFTQAEDAYEAALKHFGTSGKVWYNYALHFYRRKNLDKARATFQRGLERLAKRKHLKLIRKIAQAEYTLGTAERARTIMEGVMSHYPKRADLWSMYLDMEIKAGKVAAFSEAAKALIRRLFERVVHLDFRPRKMKFFFKRYLAFEKDHGDSGTQHHVKELAQAYVDKVVKSS